MENDQEKINATSSDENIIKSNSTTSNLRDLNNEFTANNKKASEIIKKDAVKQASANSYSFVVILLFLAILIYGFYRFKKTNFK